MTTREFLTNVKSIVDYLDFYKIDIGNEGYTLQEVYLKANELIASLDAKNAKRKSTESKEKKEVLARKQAVLSVLMATTPLSREAVADACGITAGQATSALTALVKEGLAVKSEVKVDKSKRMVYSLAE